MGVRHPAIGAAERELITALRAVGIALAQEGCRVALFKVGYEALQGAQLGQLGEAGCGKQAADVGGGMLVGGDVGEDGFSLVGVAIEVIAALWTSSASAWVVGGDRQRGA